MCVHGVTRNWTAERTGRLMSLSGNAPHRQIREPSTTSGVKRIAARGRRAALSPKQKHRGAGRGARDRSKWTRQLTRETSTRLSEKVGARPRPDQASDEIEFT